ncbi:SPW repeat protein [Salinarimonas sp. NSM]|uniref:SPW repeat protein n=1 Tax=Salinarimonas sp. NSM TaxID=3458003 RepID=UPI004036A6EA
MRSITNATEDTTLNVVTGLLGLALFVSPWVLGYADMSPAFANALVCGAAITILAFMAVQRAADWEEWINLAVGLWVAASPFVLAFSAGSTALWTHVVVGLTVAVLAGIELARIYRAPVSGAR